MTQVSGKIATLDRMIWFGEASLRKGITEFIAHYHRERNHRGLNNLLIIPDGASGNAGRVSCRKRLGGMLNCYYRQAA